MTEFMEIIQILLALLFLILGLLDFVSGRNDSAQAAILLAIFFTLGAKL